MLKLVEIPVIKPATERTQAAPTDDANNVFRVMHGFYGNLFLSKFATGEAMAGGGDGGVASARTIWAHGLRSFDVGTVKTALSRTMDAHPEFPPTLPQFVALCKACAPRPVYRDTLPPPAIDRVAQMRNACEHLAAAKAAAAAKPAPDGLSLLKQAIANAVACAGGDEGVELSRLDRLLQPKQGIPV